MWNTRLREEINLIHKYHLEKEGFKPGLTHINQKDRKIIDKILFGGRIIREYCQHNRIDVTKLSLTEKKGMFKELNQFRLSRYNDATYSQKRAFRDITNNPKNTFLKMACSNSLSMQEQILRQTFKQFYSSKKGARKGERLGFPKFKRYDRCLKNGSYTVSNAGSSKQVKIRQGVGNSVWYLTMPKAGKIKFMDKFNFLSIVDIKQVTLAKKSDKFYAAVNIEINEKPKEAAPINNIEQIIALHVNMKHGLITSDQSKNFQYVHRKGKDEKHFKRIIKIRQRRLQKIRDELKAKNVNWRKSKGTTTSVVLSENLPQPILIRRGYENK